MRKGVMFLIYQDGKFLLEKRRQDDKRSPGLVVIPGGNQEEGESTEDTLRRELKEELNITPKSWKILDIFENVALNGDVFSTNAFLVTEFEGVIVNADVKMGKRFWVTRREAKELLKLSGFRLPLFKALELIG